MNNGTTVAAMIICPPLALLVLSIVAYASIKSALGPTNDIYDEA
jgi:hypothetical protein